MSDPDRLWHIAAIGIAAVVAIIVMGAAWSLSDECKAHGGVLVKSAWGYECVQPRGK